MVIERRGIGTPDTWGRSNMGPKDVEIDRQGDEPPRMRLEQAPCFLKFTDLLEIYRYSPDEDPFDGEESAIWSLSYFFFNKIRKRVCYFHLRGLSIASHSPMRTPVAYQYKRPRPVSSLSISSLGPGASKRARYWLGDRADGQVEGGLGEDEEDNDVTIEQPGDDEVDTDEALGSDASSQGLLESEEEDELETRYRDKSSVRDMSDHITEAMEV